VTHIWQGGLECVPPGTLASLCCPLHWYVEEARQEEGEGGEEEGKSGWERKTGGSEGRKGRKREGTEEVMEQEGRSRLKNEGICDRRNCIVRSPQSVSDTTCDWMY